MNVSPPRVFPPPLGYVPARDRNFSKLGKVLEPPVPFHSSAQTDLGSRTVLVPASGHPQAWEGSQELAQANPGPLKGFGYGAGRTVEELTEVAGSSEVDM